MLPVRFQKRIQDIVGIILEKNVHGLCLIILFGSCARFKVRASSDVDIAIVTLDHMTDDALIGGLREDTEFLGDLAFFTLNRFLAKDCNLLNNIHRDGIVLWKDGDFTDAYKQLLCDCSQ
jgi:predicted nucleotidyltransferase